MARRHQRTRRKVQLLWLLLSNGYFLGFIKGKIYQGKLKNLCLPGLNCYSCPGSLGSCPIGSVQAVLSSGKHRFTFYLLGFFLLIGTVLGRFVCGFLCPFGLVQELLHKIPFPKKIKTFPGDKLLRYLKYAVLLVLVLLLPALITDPAGNGSPWFCKVLCPAGTLEGSLPLLLTNSSLRSTVGFPFFWKLSILILILLLSILIYRPFCKYFCPLGAIYALFNRISVYRYQVSKTACVDCRACEKACPMQVKPHTQTNHPECVRCGTCKEACQFGAICSGFFFRERPAAASSCPKDGQEAPPSPKP